MPLSYDKKILKTKQVLLISYSSPYDSPILAV
jgi:hypothetical protein